MEPRFGHDFSHVLIHSDPDAALGSASGQLVHGKGTVADHASRSGHALPFLDTIQSSFGVYDVTRTRAHMDRGAAGKALAMGADAFTRGPDVTFSRPPSLHTAAHEAAHVIQQRAGVEVPGGMGQEGDVYERHANEVADRVASGRSCEDLLDATPGAAESLLEAAQGSQSPHQFATLWQPVVQMRRIPANVRALLMVPGGANSFANVEGAQRLIDSAMASLSPAEQASVLANRRGALTELQFNALPIRDRLSRHAEAIIALFHGRELVTDPSLVDIGPRPGTADAANITALVANADKIFADIAAGSRDTWLTQVFGAGNVATAKEKYKRGRKAMNKLRTTNSIVTDRSGYSEEVHLGGETDPPGTPNQKIRVDKETIDPSTDPITGQITGGPDDPDSIITLLHESMHAGNADVGDKGYINSPGFVTQKAAAKLTNAAHFEVVAWRALAPSDNRAFAIDPSATPPTFQTFVPAGSSVAGLTAPALEKGQEGAKNASELFRNAWSNAADMHEDFYLPLLRKPTDWTVPRFGGKRFNKSLPYWSKVEALTIHEKINIDPASPDEAKHPVSTIDVALSEGLIRKFANGMGVLTPLKKEADVLAFEAASTTSAELTTALHGGAFRNADTQRDFLLKLVVQHPALKPMTGGVDRDVRVVRELGTLDWDTVLNPRNPDSFPD